MIKHPKTPYFILMHMKGETECCSPKEMFKTAAEAEAFMQEQHEWSDDVERYMILDARNWAQNSMRRLM